MTKEVTWSYIIASVANFYNLTPDYILWKMSIHQLLLWQKNMGYIKNGLPDKSSKEIADEIKGQFVWNETEQRYE